MPGDQRPTIAIAMAHPRRIIIRSEKGWECSSRSWQTPLETQQEINSPLPVLYLYNRYIVLYLVSASC
jgi:hypothetical protein